MITLILITVILLIIMISSLVYDRKHAFNNITSNFPDAALVNVAKKLKAKRKNQNKFWI